MIYYLFCRYHYVALMAHINMINRNKLFTHENITKDIH